MTSDPTVPLASNSGTQPLKIPLTRFGRHAPRYFSLIDASLDAVWCDTADPHDVFVGGMEWANARARAASVGEGAAAWAAVATGCRRPNASVSAGVLFIARGGTDLPSYGSLLFAAQEGVQDEGRVTAGREGRLVMWPSAVVEAHDVPHNLGAVFVPGQPPNSPTTDSAGERLGTGGRSQIRVSDGSVEAAGHASPTAAAETGSTNGHGVAQGPVLYAFGGQHIDMPSPRTRARRWHRSDGVYLLKATRLSDILTRRWFPRWRREDNISRHLLMSGRHPGCVERRLKYGNACEFDGKLSVAR